MILNTGARTDIPAFFSEWFFNRLKAGYVDVINPGSRRYYWRYDINPSVVDVIGFCTKNPKPMLEQTDNMKLLLDSYPTFWFMTITPYDNSIEACVPPVADSIETFKQLSDTVGSKAVTWRYDPIFFDQNYNAYRHMHEFANIAKQLSGYTNSVVISFVDLYEKVLRNAPFACRPDEASQRMIVKEFANIAEQYHMQLFVCHDNDPAFATNNVNVDGCQTIDVINKMTGLNMKHQPKSKARKGCNCVLNADIGAYNTCMHRCAYCYANCDHDVAFANYRMHDPNSSCLIGHVCDTDIVTHVDQKSFL